MMNMKDFFKHLIVSYTIIFCAASFLIGFVAQPFTVSGMSMQPTLKDGDVIIVSKLHLLFGEDFEEEDIITFLDPADEEKILVKRVKLSEKDGVKRYFVLGDNTQESIDSREFGSVNAEKIIGKAIFKAWPPGEIVSRAGKREGSKRCKTPAVPIYQD